MSSVNLAQCINTYRDIGSKPNCKIVQARDYTLKPYIELTCDVEKGEEILVDYGPNYPRKLKVPKAKSVKKSQFKVTKVVTKGNNPIEVGVARHVCTICNKILWSKKKRTIHRFRCK